MSPWWHSEATATGMGGDGGCLNCTLAFMGSSVLSQTPTDSPREMLHIQRTPPPTTASNKVWGCTVRTLQDFVLLNPPTVFNKNRRVTLGGDKPLTEWGKSHLERRRQGHRKRRHLQFALTSPTGSGGTAKAAIRTCRDSFSPQTMKKNTSKEPEYNARCLTVSVYCSLRCWIKNGSLHY